MIALLTAAALLAGCWGRHELNELGIVLGAGLDKTDKGYVVSLQFIDPTQMGKIRSGDRSPVLVYSLSGATVDEMLGRMTTKLPRLPYGGHLHFFVMNEAAAKEGLSRNLDYLFRNPRPESYIAIAKGYDARDILSLVTPFEVLPMMDYYRSLKLSEKMWAPSSAVRLLDLMDVLSRQERSPVLTGLTITKDAQFGKKQESLKQIPNVAEYRFDNLAVFRKDKMIGWLNEEESKTYSYLANKVEQTAGHAPCPDDNGIFGVIVTKSKVKMKPILREGKPFVAIDVDLQENVSQMACSLDISQSANIARLERQSEEYTVRMLTSSIRHVQTKFGTDIFGFGELVHHKYPKLWAGWKSDWDRQFRQLDFKVEAHVHIHGSGKITNMLGQ
jgi:spore germination protein KC